MKKHRIHINLSRILLFIIIAAVLNSIAAAAGADIPDPAESSALWKADFETFGDFSQVFAFDGEATLSEDTSKSHTGNSSLRISDRKNTFSGPAVNITEFTEPNTEYYISMYFAYMNTDYDKIRISMANSYADRPDEYTPIDTFLEPAINTWVHVEEYFTVPQDATNTAIYLEASDTASVLWVDDIIISLKQNTDDSGSTVLTPTGTSVFSFEKDNYAGISQYNNSSVTRSDSISSHGVYSLCAGNRKKYDDGVSIDVSSLSRNVTYRCSVKITFTDKTLDSENFCMYLEHFKNETTRFNTLIVPNHKTERANWSVLEGTFSIPEDAENPVIVINSIRPDGVTDYKYVPFYIDELTISDNLVTTKDKLLNEKKQKITLLAILGSLALAAVILIILTLRVRNNRKIAEASHDSMTGSYNRNAYESRIEYLSVHPEKCKKLYFAVCDVNGLKMLNDNYGHQCGDSCIIKCAGLLNKTLEKYKGTVYRTGGDEFVCISPKDFREEIRAVFETEEKRFTEYPFSAAFGFSAYNAYEDGDTPDVKAIISRCDKEMYLDKQRKKKNSY